MTAPVELFKQYPNTYFIETGSYMGDGIQQALNAGFTNVLSIELSDKYLAMCKKRFEGDARVQLVKGDAANCLLGIILKIDKPITFWLDGHFSGGETAHGVVRDPIIEELIAINSHTIKTHTIMIDDLRCMQAQVPTVLQILKLINPNYILTYHDSIHAPKDVLVAHI